jgi:hypothetical protein
MPLSAAIYTSNEALSSVRDAVRKRSEGFAVKPYTFSFAHKMETGAVRVRATELAEGVLMPVVREMVKKGEATLASCADREVREAAYEELREDGDRTRRVATIRFTSPTIVEVQGEYVPFPVIHAMFAGYREIWSAFSPVPLHEAPEAMEHLHVTDFKISCAAAGPIGAGTSEEPTDEGRGTTVPSGLGRWTERLLDPREAVVHRPSTSFRVGAEGWVTLEMERGRTEQEIAFFNTLIDFAFYCGTGAHTDEGLGQTKRGEKRWTRDDRSPG